MNRMTDRKRTIAGTLSKPKSGAMAQATVAIKSPVVKPKLRPASKGRVHKGKTRS